jgi:hypothetical protein
MRNVLWSYWSDLACGLLLTKSQRCLITIGSNRSLRSLGRAKARPLTKR